MMTYALARLCMLFACLLFGTALNGTGAAAQGSAENVTWTRLPGLAVDVAINSQGQAYVVAPDGGPWRWDAQEQRWRNMSGFFRRITAAEDNHPWALNADGVVFRYNGLWWENKGTDVVDVAADALGNVFIAKANGDIKKWNPLRSEWGPVPGTARRIALDMAGQPWVVTPNGRVRAFDGRNWVDMPGRALDIAIGGDDTKVIADLDGKVRRWNALRNRWELVAGVDDVTAVAVAPDGGPWALTPGNAIMATTLIVAPEQIKTEKGRAPEAKAPEAHAAESAAPVAVAPTIQADPANPVPLVAPSQAAQPVQAVPPAPVQTVAAAPPSSPSSSPAATPAAASNTVAPASATPTAIADDASRTTKDRIVFVDTKATAESLAIGKDGSVFGLDVAGNVLRWSNARRRFESFPGTLARLAVDPQGNPWGISALGRVFRHTGVLWRQIPNAVGSDIAIGADGTVILAQASGSLLKLNEDMTRFTRIPGNGLRVAVAPDGTPWTIRSDNLVQRCASVQCDLLPQKASDIAIGPDGSVFVIALSGTLMRLKDDGRTFALIPTLGMASLSVAVGPNGFPWIATTAKAVLSAHFFERDEAKDRAVSASTAGDTQGTGATAAIVPVPSATSFTFSKNMQFETITKPTGSLDGIAIGQDGNVYAHVNAGDFQIPDYKVLIFNAKKKAFETHTANFPNAITAMDADAQGNIWGIDGNTPPNVYRVTSSGVRKSYTLASATGSASNLTIGNDGSIYVVVNGLMYRMAAGSASFSKFSNDGVRKVAIGLSGDLWILDENYIVQQYTGSRFENRPRGQSIAANDIGVGEDGTVYIAAQSNNALKKWNASNGSFDTVNGVTADMVDVAEDGRPWIADTSFDSNIKRGKD